MVESKRYMKKARDVLQNEGIKALIKRIFYHMNKYRKGGLSSRPTIGQFAGLLDPLYNAFFNFKYGKGTKVMDEDWDNLIILDACRYDDFICENTINGKLESRISRGANSERFLMANFNGQEIHDTVYVTANPHARKLNSDVFHKIVDTPLKEWNSEYQCILPESVTAASIKAHEEFPHKRLIIHYMQPHDPPIGKKASELADDSIEWGGPATFDVESKGVRLMAAVASGSVDVQMAREAYRENLRIVLQEVQELLNHLNGKSVISADHGELFGERPYPILGSLYEHGHPRNLKLCKVPWLVIEGKSRRSILSEEPAETKRVGEDKIEAQLKALGYK